MIADKQSNVLRHKIIGQVEEKKELNRSNKNTPAYRAA